MTRLLDSDIVNYLLEDVPAVVDRYSEAVNSGCGFLLSPVVHYEITRYLKLKQAVRRLRVYEALIQNWLTAGLTAEDWQMASDLWAQRHRVGRPIGDADLLIAIAALRAGATLVTNNTRHFDGLGVALENWSQP